MPLRRRMTAELYELLAVFCSSAGILGTAVSAVLAWMLRRAKKDAEEKRAERIAMELFRLEGEELLSALVLTLVRVNGGNDPAVEGAAKAYEQHLEKRKHFRNQLISNHTIG